MFTNQFRNFMILLHICDRSGCLPNSDRTICDGMLMGSPRTFLKNFRCFFSAADCQESFSRWPRGKHRRLLHVLPAVGPPDLTQPYVVIGVMSVSKSQHCKSGAVTFSLRQVAIPRKDRSCLIAGGGHSGQPVFFDDQREPR